MKNISLFIAILLLAGLLRLWGINWDQGHYLHPDERFLTMVVNDLKLPSGFLEYLDPQRSPLNPYNSKFHFFVYGTFPVNLNKLLVNIFNADDYGNIGLFGRTLSALFDLGALCLVFLIVKLWERAFSADPRLKYLAAFFYGVAVFPVQQAHFFTVDSFLNCLMLASFYFSLKSFFSRKILNALLAGLFFGLALGTKVSAVYILPLNLLLIALYRKEGFSVSFGYLFEKLHVKAGALLLFTVTSYLALRTADPKFFMSGNFFNLTINPRFIDNIRELAGYSNFGEGLPMPPSVQWIGKPAVIFAAKNIILFGVGGAYFILCLLGLYRILAQRRYETSIVILWAAGIFLWQSSQFVKTMRYFYCLYPFLAVLAACGVLELHESLGRGRAGRILRAVAAALVLLWPYSFMQIYNRPHSRVTASEWIYRNIPEGSVLAQIHWDDYLPLHVPGYDRRYQTVELPVFAPDDDNKWREMDEALAKADYIVFSSNRGYDSIMPLPHKYPRMSPFFRDLFEGRGGYVREAEIVSFPSLNLIFTEIPISDRGSEEAFTVYDHPQITIFKKVS